MATIELTHKQYYNNLIGQLRDLEVIDAQLLRYISMAIRRAELVRDNPTKVQQ